MPQTRRTAATLATIALAGSLLTCSPAADAHSRGDHPGQAASRGTFVRTSTFPDYLNSTKEDVAVAEISTVTPDLKTLVYTDAGGKRIGFVDIRNAGKPRPLGTVSVPGETSARTGW